MALTINGTTGIETNTDTGKVKVGIDDDLQIYHNGNNSIIDSNTGNLEILSDAFYVNNAANNEVQIKAVANGNIELYYNGSKKFETQNGGCHVTGSLTADTVAVQDNEKFLAGNNDDLQIYHNGSNSYITDSGTGALRINSNDARILNAAGTEDMIRCQENGSVELYYDNSKKLETYSEGVYVTGYLKSSSNWSDSHWGAGQTHDWNMMSQHDDSNSVCIFENSANSTPYGIEVLFTDAQPDNNSQNFYAAYDHSGSDFVARFKVFSDGDAWTSDAGYLTSDETLKENITDATPKLEDIKKLKVRNFNWKSSYHPEKSKKKQLGFIAQEVEEIFPALITEFDLGLGHSTNGESYTPTMKKSIKAAWDPIIIKAMQELIAKVETLETKVAALEAA